MTVDNILLTEVKNKLRITWDDEDDQVKELVLSAMADINNAFKKTFDYTKAGLPKTLLKEHAFYNRNNVLHEFRKDYAAELTQLMIDAAIGKYDDAAPK